MSDAHHSSSEGRARPPDEPLRALPQRNPLGHAVPAWVADGSVFFVTICAALRGSDELTRGNRGAALIASVGFLHRQCRWFAHLFVVMPDHVHALLSFPPDESLQKRVSGWKSYTSKMLGIEWQDRCFDHRLRSDESFAEKAHSIRMSPVRAGLAKTPGEWRWVFDGSLAGDDHGSSGTPRPTHSTPSHA